MRRSTDSTADEQTFIFADLSGFTALTELHGDDQAAELALGFGDACREVLAEHQATEVKTIGDAIMLRCPDAAEAIRLSLRIVHDIGDRHAFPTIRVGMHTGSAVERDGDWFGATVNISARVSGEAGGGHVLLTEATRNSADDLAEIRLLERGRRVLRNVKEPVSLFEAVRNLVGQPDALPIDPVCRMAVDPTHAAGSLNYEGTSFYFCSLDCASAFAGEPASYAAAAHAE